jgi:hypothetical protein
MAPALAVVLISLGVAAPSASAAEFNFGLGAVAASETTTSAARHPDLTTSFEIDVVRTVTSPKTKDVVIGLPAGLYGDPNAVPRCATGYFEGGMCPVESQVGISIVSLNTSGAPREFTTPVYNLDPPHPDSEVARLGFLAVNLPVFIDISVRTAGDYGISASVHDAPGLEAILGTETIIWGNPADSSHDKSRLTPQEAIECESGTACKAPGGERGSSIPLAQRRPFLTNPSSCGPLEASFAATSYQLPGQVFAKNSPMAPISACEAIPFVPTLEARPTTDVAGAPTGLRTNLFLPQHPDPEEAATATMREARVTLPEGMTINPSAADGLTACADAQVHFHEDLDAQCPDGSKLGTATITSPALSRPLQGALYQRTPGGKGSQFRLWLVSDDLGLHIHIPGEVKADPQTGQLTAVFADLPQVPTEKVEIEIWGGANAPLKNPDVCGTYETTSLITPWSDDPAATPADRYEIGRTPNGGSCPTTSATEANAPGFEAGSERPISATYSPFLLRLRRADGSQQFGHLDLTLPPGLVGKLAGLGQCPDAVLAAAADKTGKAEQSSPSCPQSSRVGTLYAAAGAGPDPYWTRGTAYLAGPYQGAPLSIAIITPAVAGPFDLGTVVVRSGIYLDPQSAQIRVKADLPRIIEGVPLNLRTAAVDADRPGFTLNGTSCEPLAFTGTLTSVFGNPAPLTSRFQLAECARLPFKPKLTLALKGSTKRSSNPALVADLRARPGDANIARAQVRFPQAAFIDNAHFDSICTRVQFAADHCPKGSVYGSAWATSPLLDYKVKGKVYLRSSDHLLPDLVVKLQGPQSQRLEFDLVGKNDSVHGALRNTFEVVPDVPVNRFHLQLFGGKRSLIELSSGLCRNPRAAFNFTAQNGRVYDTAPKVKTSCGNGSRKNHHGNRPHHR